jgi:tetratricopeptide (TPR) repeat protein
VANVMEGSVQRAGNRVRINVQLIDASTDEHLWADIYDRELTTTNLFDIQSEIAKAIAGALKASLTAAELANVEDVPTDNVEAYDLYLQARRVAETQIMSSNQTAIDFFKKSLALDPDFKFAWIGLANAHMNNYWIYGGDPANRELAHEAIEQARRIDSDFAELYVAEGVFWYWGRLDYERALYNLEKAIDMMPGNDEAHMWRAYVSRRVGKWDQALQSMNESMKLNPRIAFNWHEYAQTFKYMHRYDEANSAIKQALALEPDNLQVKTSQADIVLQQSGDTQMAVELSSGAHDTDEYDIFRVVMRVYALARQFDELLKIAREMPGDLEIQRSLIGLKEDWAAQILFYMGREEEAKKSANAALFRLNGLRTELGDDYRIDLAMARLSAILGEKPDELTKLVQKAMASRPKDELAALQSNLFCAQIYAMAGMAPEAIELLDGLMLPPSQTSVFDLELNPAFDKIRDDPEFVALVMQYK